MRFFTNDQIQTSTPKHGQEFRRILSWYTLRYVQIQRGTNFGRAHNPEVAGSSPTPAIQKKRSLLGLRFFCISWNAGLEPKLRRDHNGSAKRHDVVLAAEAARRESARCRRPEGESCPCYSTGAMSSLASRLLYCWRKQDSKRRGVREYLERRGTRCAESTGGGLEGDNRTLSTGRRVLPLL